MIVLPNCKMLIEIEILQSNKEKGVKRQKQKRQRQRQVGYDVKITFSLKTMKQK